MEKMESSIKQEKIISSINFSTLVIKKNVPYFFIAEVHYMGNIYISWVTIIIPV